MTISTLSLQNYTLLIAGIINLVMSILVFSRGIKHNKVNRYFSLLTFFNFLWALSLFFARVLPTNDWLFWARLAYPSSLGIALSLFYFSVYFPFAIKKISKVVNYIIILPAIFFTIIPYVNNLFIISYSKHIEQTLYILYYNKLLYISFGVYFSILVFITIIHLIKKYKVSENIFRKQILFLLIAIVIGLIAGSYFDLIICYFGNFKHAWAGPPFTLLMNFVVFYLIFHNKEN